MISTVSSATSARSSGRRKKLRTPAKKSRTSCSAKALSSDSIGVLCVTFAKLAAGAAPTRSDGLSARISSGKRASIAALRRRSSSYSASEISGASSRVIEPVVMRDLGGEPRQLGPRLVLGQRLDRPRRPSGGRSRACRSRLRSGDQAGGGGARLGGDGAAGQHAGDLLLPSCRGRVPRPGSRWRAPPGVLAIRQ